MHQTHFCKKGSILKEVDDQSDNHKVEKKAKDQLCECLRIHDRRTHQLRFLYDIKECIHKNSLLVYLFE